MKQKNYLLHFLTILQCLFFITVFSCASSDANKKNDSSAGWQVKNGDPEKYFSIKKNEKIKLMPEWKKGSPVLDISLSLLGVTDNDLRIMLQDTLYDKLSTNAYAAKIRSRWFADYTAVRYVYLKQIEESDVQSFDWGYSEDFSGVVWNGALQVERRRYTYSGGAHGMPEINYFVFDTQKLKRIRLSDILINGYAGGLQKAVDSALRLQYEVHPAAPLSSAGFFEDTAALTENFYIPVSGAGLGLSWNPVEIAPYVMGTITVVLPPEIIAPLLNQRGRELFTAINLQN